MVNPQIGTQPAVRPSGSDPWSDHGGTYVAAVHNAASAAPFSNDDEYSAELAAPDLLGTDRYVFRFGLDRWVTATDCEPTGAGSHEDRDFDPTELGTLTVMALT